jgi:phosphoserine phosphatase
MPAATIALFDLDRTLLTIDADEAWVEFLLGEGALDRGRFEPAVRDVADRYRRGEIGIHEFCEFYLSTLTLHEPAQLEAWRVRYLDERIFPAISPAARIAREAPRGRRPDGADDRGEPLPQRRSRATWASSI